MAAKVRGRQWNSDYGDDTGISDSISQEVSHVAAVAVFMGSLIAHQRYWAGTRQIG